MPESARAPEPTRRRALTLVLGVALSVFMSTAGVSASMADQPIVDGRAELEVTSDDPGFLDPDPSDQGEQTPSAPELDEPTPEEAPGDGPTDSPEEATTTATPDGGADHVDETTEPQVGGAPDDETDEDEAVEDVESVITDSGLKACLNPMWGKPAEAPISAEQVAMVTSLRCYAQHTLVSLDGMQHATNLSIVELRDQPGLADLGPLRGLPLLRMIHLTNTGVTSLEPLSSIASIGALRLEGGPLNSLSGLAGVEEIGSLLLIDSKVTDLGPLSDISIEAFIGTGLTGVWDFSPIGPQAAYVQAESRGDLEAWSPDGADRARVEPVLPVDHRGNVIPMTAQRAGSAVDVDFTIGAATFEYGDGAGPFGYELTANLYRRAWTLDDEVLGLQVGQAVRHPLMVAVSEHERTPLDTGGQAPRGIEFDANDALPDGLELRHGVISGTPTQQAEPTVIAVTATDALGNATVGQIKFTLAEPQQPVEPTDPPTGQPTGPADPGADGAVPGGQPVEDAGHALPRTGGPSAWLLIGGVGLVGAGAASAWWARRRRAV